MGNYNYSIIIPTKNIPELLTRALNTIPQRDDIQVIVVDDNSDPEKVDFNNYPGTGRMSTIVVFNKDGLGAGHARNVGLLHATGKWVLFMDSDDLYTANAFNLLDEHLDDCDDIVYFGITSKNSDDMTPSDRHQYKMSMLSKIGKEKEQVDFFCRFLYTEPWGKMINRNLIERNNILFDETLVANDFMFSLKTGYMAKSVSCDKRELYCLTVRRGSLSNQIFDTLPKMLSRLAVTYEAQLFFNDKKIKQYPFMHYVRKIKRQDAEIRNAYYRFLKERKISKSWLFGMTILYQIDRIYRNWTGKFWTSYIHK